MVVKPMSTTGQTGNILGQMDIDPKLMHDHPHTPPSSPTVPPSSPPALTTLGGLNTLLISLAPSTSPLDTKSKNSVGRTELDVDLPVGTVSERSMTGGDATGIGKSLMAGVKPIKSHVELQVCG